MTYRVERDESDFSDAKLLAWEIVLPYRYLPIIQNDEHRAIEVEETLRQLFTTYELHIVGKRIKEKHN